MGIQTVVPAWVRARALSVYLLFFSASLTGGSVLWGLVAERTGASRALLFSAAGQVLVLLLTFRLRLPSGEGLNLAPSRQWPAPIVSHESAASLATDFAGRSVCASAEPSIEKPTTSAPPAFRNSRLPRVVMASSVKRSPRA